MFSSSSFRSNSKAQIDKTETMDFLENPSMSSNPAFSLSSEMNLSVLLQSIQEVSSSSSSSTNTFDHPDNGEKHSTTSLSRTLSQQSSDNESVLYLHLPIELNIDVATIESDFDR